MPMNIPRTSSSDRLATLNRLSNLDFLSVDFDGTGEEGAGEDVAEAFVRVSCPADDARDLVHCRLRDMVVHAEMKVHL